jgi:hypothetical protein
MSLASARLAAASGFAFVALFVAALFVLDIPGHDDSEEIVNAFYADSGNRARVVIAAYLLAIAGLSFLWFLAHLRGRLSAAEGEPATLSAVSFAGGVVFVAMLFAGAAAQSPTYAFSVDLFDEPQSQLARATIPHQGYSALIFGLLAAALTVASASLAIMRTEVYPLWLAWLGFAVAVLLLFGLLFLPILALLVWVLAVSVVLLRGDSVRPVLRSR